jgi:hypothetical protein
MKAKVKIIITNLDEFQELYQELREKEKGLKEVLDKLEKFNLDVNTAGEKVKE